MDCYPGISDRNVDAAESNYEKREVFLCLFSVIIVCLIGVYSGIVILSSYSDDEL